jgi:hypothetical protein
MSYCDLDAQFEPMLDGIVKNFNDILVELFEVIC